MLQSDKLIPSLSVEGRETFYQIAHVHYSQGNYAEAVNLFRLLTILDTRSKKFWMGLAASLQLSKEYTAAVTAYEMVICLDPTAIVVHFHVADCLFANQQKKEAIFALECAERAILLQKKPDANLLAHLNLMRLAWGLQKNQQKVKNYG